MGFCCCALEPLQAEPSLAQAYEFGKDYATYRAVNYLVIVVLLFLVAVGVRTGLKEGFGATQISFIVVGFLGTGFLLAMVKRLNAIREAAKLQLQAQELEAPYVWDLVPFVQDLPARMHDAHGNPLAAQKINAVKAGIAQGTFEALIFAIGILFSSSLGLGCTGVGIHSTLLTAVGFGFFVTSLGLLFLVARRAEKVERVINTRFGFPQPDGPLCTDNVLSACSRC